MKLPGKTPVFLVMDGKVAVGVLINLEDTATEPAAAYSMALAQEKTSFPLVAKPKFKDCTWGHVEKLNEHTTDGFPLPVFDVTDTGAHPVVPDKKQAQDADSKEKAALNKQIGVTAIDGETVAVTVMDRLSSEWRQQAVQLLRIVDPAAYKKYREIKYAKGKNPDLEVRMAAYMFAIRRFLEISYTKAGI